MNMTLDKLETIFKELGLFMVLDEALCELTVFNNELYPNGYRRHYSLFGYMLDEILSIVKAECPLRKAA